MSYGFVSEDEVEISAGGGDYQFGLNQGAVVTAAKVITDGGRDKDKTCFQFSVEVGGREFSTRIFEADKVYQFGEKKGEEKDDDVYGEQVKSISAMISHITRVVTGAPKDKIKAAFKSVKSFEALIKKTEMVCKKAVAAKKKVDVFLEYQTKIRTGQKQTYLQLPANMYGGHWLAKNTEGVAWTSKNNEETGGLEYINADGETHPFKKSEYFMKSDKAAIQKIEGDSKKANPLSKKKRVVKEDPVVDSSDDEDLWDD